MRDHYDFSEMKGRKNPFSKRLKKPITVRLDADTVDDFKSMADEKGIPYQTLIDLYLPTVPPGSENWILSGVWLMPNLSLQPVPVACGRNLTRLRRPAEPGR